MFRFFEIVVHDNIGIVCCQKYYRFFSDKINSNWNSLKDNNCLNYFIIVYNNIIYYIFNIIIYLYKYIYILLFLLQNLKLELEKIACILYKVQVWKKLRFRKNCSTWITNNGLQTDSFFDY